jgi:hypothetical protein
MRRDPRVALSLTDITNPYRMTAVQGRVVEVRSDEGCRYMDPISFKYTNAPFPSRGPRQDRLSLRDCKPSAGRCLRLIRAVTVS